MDYALTISTDKKLLDIDYIHDFLQSSYWAKNIPRDAVIKSIDHSLCFGLYMQGQQFGFARVITDYTAFAYIADVFIDEGKRGNGLGKKLIAYILSYPELQGLRRWYLATEDAQGLYAQFGFKNPQKPENHMEIRLTPNYEGL